MKLRLWIVAFLGILVLYSRETRAGVSAPSNVAAATTPASSSPGTTAAVNEWYGPFASWGNVKTTYGAVGDGVTDDTVAISNALANVGLGSASPVLYFPPGTYRVTAKLWLRNRQYVEVVGHSPQDTMLKYDGATDPNFSGPSTLFHSDGTGQCHFARLTFNGNNKSMTVFSQSESPGWTFFDGGNIFMDCVFENSASGGHGVDAGYYGDGFAGEGFTRCVFTNLGVGLETWNYNALDGYLNDCYMANCGTAIYINPGSAHAYHTTFVNNGIDFWLNPAANFISLVSNVSYHAGTFFKATNQGLNTTPMLLKGNTVIDPTGALAVDVGQPAHMIMLDNTIASSNNAAVSFSNSLQIDLVAVGNTNTFASWLSIGSGSGGKTNLVDNGVVSRSSLSFPAPALPIVASNLGRTIVDMPASYTSTTLQAAINSAADGTVIHIPWSAASSTLGYLTSTITIPPNTDIRIVGDGPMSRLYWNGAAGSPMFSLAHPSHATFSHLQLYGNTTGSGSADVQVSGVGTTPARVYLRDVMMKQGINAGVRLGDCPNTVIEYFGQGIGEASLAPANGANVILDGRGKVRLMDVDCDSGIVGYICTNGGALYMETHYGEAANTTGNRIMKVSGNSTVTFLCGKAVANIGPLGETFDRATSNGYQVVNFTGSLTLACVGEVIDWMNISGATTGNIWINSSTTARSPVSTWPIINSTSDNPIQTMNWDAPVTTQRYADVGTASASYTRQMLQQARAEYSDRAPMTRRANQTDVLLEQVYMELGQQNLWVTP
jgi:pectate lyase-like protein